jgi:oligoendopeptidase F
MNDEERNILAYILENPDQWYQNVLTQYGEEVATTILNKKVEKYRTLYNQAILDPNYMTRLERENLLMTTNTESISASVALFRRRKSDIDINMPSLSTVTTSINSISNISGVRDYLKKLSKVVYWLAKNNDV